VVWHAGNRISQKTQKQVEECFGWLKTIVLLLKLQHRGLFKVEWAFTFACAAYYSVGRMSGIAQTASSCPVIVRNTSCATNAAEARNAAQSGEKANMLWTIMVILLVMWLLGFSFHIAGGLIHLLLVIAVVILIVNLVRRTA
jgi:hypothetical protein